jgi:gamma-glutamyl-gamma-aminobutyrate hydrolase PuuD
MKIGISMEMTRKLRNTWHSALNHEWYDFMSGHDIVPISCHGVVPQTDEFDLIILAGGNDMIDIKTWRDNHYPLRDVFERRLIEQAMLTKTPVMGICRGAHFINWVLGGTHRLMTTPYDNVVVNLSAMQVTCHHTICIDKLASGFEILETDTITSYYTYEEKFYEFSLVDFNPEQNQVLVEYIKRQEFIKGGN